MSRDKTFVFNRTIMIIVIVVAMISLNAILSPFLISNYVELSSNTKINVTSKITKSKNCYHRAILIHEPNIRRYSQIFTHFIYNSWIYLLRVEHEYRNKYNLNFTNIIDIIVVIPPNYHQILPKQCRFIKTMSKIQISDLSKNNRNISLCLILYVNNTLHNEQYHETALKKYHFLPSIDCVITFEQQYPDLFYHYDYMIRTDDDTFLTPFFLYKFPLNHNEFIVGKGGYYWGDITKQHLLNMSKILGLKHCITPFLKCFNLGSTWYGSPTLIYNVANLTLYTTKYIFWLFDTKQTDIDNWSGGWFHGVASLYGSEIAVNHEIAENEKYILRTYRNDNKYILLDDISYSKKYINKAYEVVHIHAWPNMQFFSKYVWKKKQHRAILGDISIFLNGTKYNYTEIRMWCGAIAYDLHWNLSTKLFDIDTLLLQQNLINQQMFDKYHVKYPYKLSYS